MRFGILAGAALTLAYGGIAQAQDTIHWAAPVTSAQAGEMTYFPMGTPLTLSTRTQVSTKDNKPGDRLYLDVAETLSYRGQPVIPAGSVAVAEVVRADHNGHFGKKGKLDVKLLYVETSSGPVRLSGQAYDEGTSGTITSVATMALVSPLGFLVHGTSAHIPFGTVVKAYLAENMRFYEQPVSQVVDARIVQPDMAPQPLPARFDPRAFGGAGARLSAR